MTDSTFRRIGVSWTLIQRRSMKLQSIARIVSLVVLEVGGPGNAADNDSTTQPGGANGGGQGSRLGGSGGGASDVRTCSITAPTCSVCPIGSSCSSLSSRLVVAGGGGGAGSMTHGGTS